MKKINKNVNIFNSLKQTLAFVVLMIFCFDFALMPLAEMMGKGLADLVEYQNSIDKMAGDIIPVMDNRIVLKDVVKKTIINTSFSAYTSEAVQCDSSPCITANGFNLCRHGIEDTVAANFLPFGTKIKIPEYFGDQIFVVRDRMNKRYANKIDVWMKDRSTAIQFGKKSGIIEIVE